MWPVDRSAGRLLSSPEEKEECVTTADPKVLSEHEEASWGS